MYKATDVVVPFWGAETTKKSGRDPLAIQNSSVVIYVNMISGITNVTTRVRYNGFFCWLLTFIAEKLQSLNPSKTDNPNEQIKYIRRGELLLAYSMHNNYPQVIGVNGSTYTAGHFEDDIINVSVGADIENKPYVYWQNTMGVYGQYYLGVLSQLQLIFMPDSHHRTYRVTPKGYALCNAFRRSLSQDEEDLFWDAISSGMITKDNLNLFKGIALHFIDNDKELEEYEKIFSAPDKQNSLGKEVNHRFLTIKLILNYIQTNGLNVERRLLVLSFLKHNFLNTLVSELEVSEEQLSWFMYELNELTHAAYEAYHFAIVYLITEEPLPLDSILEKLECGFNDIIKKYIKDDYDIYGLYDRLQTCYRKKEYGELVFFATQLLVSLYKVIEKHYNKLLEFGRMEEYDIHPGFAPSLLYKLVGSTSGICDWSLAEDCIYSAINDHLRSSYSKSSIGQGIVHNYMVDNNLIWLIRRTVPIRTSPRLQNVLQYLEDMKWIGREDDSYVVTNRGKEILLQK